MVWVDLFALTPTAYCIPTVYCVPTMYCVPTVYCVPHCVESLFGSSYTAWYSMISLKNCGATILDFWWRLHWLSKPGWIPCLHDFIARIPWVPQILLYKCDTCWPLGSQNVQTLVDFQSGIEHAAASQCETWLMHYRHELCRLGMLTNVKTEILLIDFLYFKAFICEIMHLPWPRRHV